MDNSVSVPPGRIRLLPHFRFIWGAKEVVRGNWFLGLVGFHTKGYPRELWIYLSVRGALRWGSGSAVAAYFLGAALLAYIYGKNPYNRIGYTDLILPTQWSELRTLRGQALIDEGMAKLKAGQYAPAFMLLNQGIARKPDNIAARLVVGQMYASLGYLHRAMQVYRGGLAYAGDQRRFIDTTFQLAEYMEDYEQVLEIVTELERAVPVESTLLRRLLEEKRILAYEKLGRHEAILTLWESKQAHPSMRLNAARLRALSATGQGAEAIAALEANPAQYGLLREPWELLLELARENHRPELGRRAVNALVALEPTRYRFHARRIAYLAEIGAEAEALALVDDYFLRFGGDVAANGVLLKSIEQHPTAVLNSKIWSLTLNFGGISPTAGASYVQNLMRLGDIAQAKEAFAQTRQEIIRSKYPDKGWLEGTGLLLELIQSDSPSNRNLLTSFATAIKLSPENFRGIISILSRNGRDATAREIAMLARNRFPAIREIPASVFELPKPDDENAIAVKSTAAEFVVPISTASNELKELEAALDAKQWEAALNRIPIVEKSPLARNLGEQLLYWRIAIHGHLSNQTEVSWYMRRLLEHGRLDATRLRNMAGNLHDAGHQDSALTILREVIRKHPDARWASDQIRVWTADIKSAASTIRPE